MQNQPLCQVKAVVAADRSHLSKSRAIGWHMRSASSRLTVLIVLAVAPILSSIAVSQERKQVRFTVGPRPFISVTNQYGSITVQPSGNNQVVVTTLAHSDDVGFTHEQHGNRIELRADSKSLATGLADYTVLVPSDAIVSLRSLDGSLHVEGLRGDIVLEGGTATVEVADVRDAHVHVKTLSGPVTLNGVRHSHLDIHSVSGNVNIHEVTESFVEVTSGSGRITYGGDPGEASDYLLTSHSGDLDISIPAKASVEIKSHSLKGKSDQPTPNAGSGPATDQKNLFVNPGIVSGSRFVLRSFKGAIRIKRP